MNPRSHAAEDGFTLVEVIITLLVAVILGSVRLQYLGSAVSRSSTPMERLAADALLHETADNIIGAFRQTAPADSGAWSDFRNGPEQQLRRLPRTFQRFHTVRGLRQ